MCYFEEKLDKYCIRHTGRVLISTMDRNNSTLVSIGRLMLFASLVITVYGIGRSREEIETRSKYGGTLDYKVYVEENQPATVPCDQMSNSMPDFIWLQRSYSSSVWNKLNVSSHLRINETAIWILDIANVTSEDNDMIYQCGVPCQIPKTTPGFPLCTRSLIKTYKVDENYKSIRAVGSDRICLQIYEVDFITPDIVLNRITYTLDITYQEKGTGQWQKVGSRSDIVPSDLILNGLKRNTTYLIRSLISFHFHFKYYTIQYKWVTTLKEDIKYEPTVSILRMTGSSIAIEWTAPPPELEGYISFYNASLQGGLQNEKQFVSQIRKLSHIFKGLSAEMKYDVQVQACSVDACRHAYTGTILKDVYIKLEDELDPYIQPTIFLNGMTNDSINIGWYKPDDSYKGPVIGYYHPVLSAQYVTIESVYVNGTTLSFSFENLLQNVEYEFHVTACGKYKLNCGNRSVPIKAMIRGTSDSYWIHIGIWVIASALILLICMSALTVWKLRQKSLKRKLIKARLEYFNNGDATILSPDVAVSDQAELLPYLKKYEFPRSLLILGDVLGSGAFGVVRKGQAKTIRSREAVTTVAVKTVRATASLDCMTALLRELRILCYLGEHLNLVSLLGACTKNIEYGQLFVIVEFCRFGNLHDYLWRHRRDFVNQLDTDTAEIRDQNPSEDAIDTNDQDGQSGSEGDENPEAEDCGDGTNVTSTSMTTDLVVTGAEATEPRVPFKYPGDYRGIETDPLRTRDLVFWAWQISRGMQYLSAKKVLHGDLAARNILLSDNNVVKICDFGLSKSLREEENFTNNERGPLPVKWMAIESLRDRVFSTKSDVWSYGVVLWELFSLADTPYHGIRPEYMCQTLIEGYRMERPKYAPQILYDIMLHCWKEEPSERPSFESLAWKISDMVDEHVKLYYLDLGNPYTEIYADVWKRERETVIKGETPARHEETQPQE
ncbi:vascular endothelial growth factor receptor 1-like isoform X1 [Neodiprion pinetum]|uniref:vascular endothelial growth factor receptor 1-like isoform X1 n=2 Tax=Neodiprion pinetum TaxID=441929 RepID=UPI001EDE0C90|nr:vascular endothelial growth factor receptor 1-like isoform X1 [Neodiprion pinetum]